MSLFKKNYKRDHGRVPRTIFTPWKIWRCKGRTCRGRIAATPAEFVTEVRSLNDHEASHARVELAQVRERMNELATAGQIFNASIVSCSNEVLAILPKESVTKCTINNHKAPPPIELVGVNGIGQIPETYSRTLGANQQLFLR